MANEFLRRHPEIGTTLSEAIEETLKLYKSERDVSPHEAAEILAAVLPAILRAHEADLAGGVRATPLEISATIVGNFEHEGSRSHLSASIQEAIAAAYLAGRAAGREDVAKLGDDRVDGLRSSASNLAASNDRKGAIEASAAAEEIRLLVEEIRSLP